MTSRELISAIIQRKTHQGSAFWLGNPKPETIRIYHRYFGTKNDEELRQKLGDDFRWVTPQYLPETYRHHDGKGIFDIWKQKKSLGEPGPLGNVRKISEVDEYDWPDARYLNLDEALKILDTTGEYYRASGFWCPFFHDVMDLVGAENYMTKAYTDPDIIDAITNHVCSFYLQANEIFYKAAGLKIDAFFFGNDFGTQRDLLLSPSQFDRFILPYIKRLIEQARSYGYQIILHSCGSVHDVIEKLISAGVQCLHPIQARAAKMDALTLAHDFGGRISFMGGIDTQEILVNSSPADVKREVRRIKKLLDPYLIVSPSHEALLADVPPENVAAMAEAAHE